jgi:peptidoglycan L-alanyl-D-glutamate endopeptidase CwlK
MLDQDSLNKLNTCHPDLITLIMEASKYLKLKVIEGHRGMEEQNKAFNEGKSKLRWPDGKHNSLPSNAIDIAPLINGKIEWNKASQFYYTCGYILGIAEMLLAQGKIKHKIRYGGDWDRDGNISNQTFNDLVHIELIP